MKILNKMFTKDDYTLYIKHGYTVTQAKYGDMSEELILIMTLDIGIEN